MQHLQHGLVGAASAAIGDTVENLAIAAEAAPTSRFGGWSGYFLALLLGTALPTHYALAQLEPTDKTATPIKHVVVIFQENVSFDHYFATYPNAANLPGEPAFKARRDTPSVNGLTPELIAYNPNSTKPFRLARTQAKTCDQGHDYSPEQQAVNGGLMDKFVEKTGATESGCDPAQVMGYFDGNTVTALWNYAQHFAISDNHFGTVFGPSTVGALNLVAGQTAGAITETVMTTDNPPEPEVIVNTVVGDPQPQYDDCSTRDAAGMTGRNVGDLLNAKHITWGFFEGGFRPTEWSASGKAVCGAKHIGSNGKTKGDYIPHHQPFQYYESTANPHHLPPTSAAMIGKQDSANHQYDLVDFWEGAAAHNIPAVSFLKAPGYQDGHAGYSDPLAEQQFLVDTINKLQRLPEWQNMAIIIAYDDSDGWYDHVMPPIISPSNMTLDALTGPGSCGQAATGGYQGRCGYGPRLPLLIISPYAKQNFVDHAVTDQSSILRFIEDNWELGRIGNQSFDEKAGALLNMFDFSRGSANQRLYLSPVDGQVVRHKEKQSTAMRHKKLTIN